jgi:hypothetical protein
LLGFIQKENNPIHDAAFGTLYEEFGEPIALVSTSSNAIELVPTASQTVLKELALIRKVLPSNWNFKPW